MKQPAVVGVAYSGGRDSTALLHATLEAARRSGVQVAALHVHHGLSPFADDWLTHCEDQCARWARKGLPVRLLHEHLHLKPARGQSIEALARTARYAALRRLAQLAGAGIVLLAHHRRDQAETFLLQALRGAGVAGLSGMPAAIEREGVTWARPWLGQSRQAVEAYVRGHRLAHIDDDSNDDPRFARNRLRLGVWPPLLAAFPQAEATLADAAAWSQEAAACLADLAAIDLAALRAGDRLDLAAWSELPAHRARNALRAWLRGMGGEAPTAAELTRLCDELPGRSPATWTVKTGVLRRYRDGLTFERHGDEMQAASLPPPETALRITRAGRHALPGWGGQLVVRRVAEGGVALDRLGELRLAPRHGGEQFQAGTGRPARALKKQYQSAAVPAWAREGPLLYDGEQLVFAPGLGVDARVLAVKGEPQVSLEWVPQAAARS
jgi:tRNA(Ile)-lysidine synthase